MRSVELLWFGTVPYDLMQSLQLALVAARIRDLIPDLVMVLEHQPVVTIGKGGGQENLILPAEELRAKGVERFETERGGNITYHGPGQLIVYPILDLRNYRTDVHWYVHQMEQMTMDLLSGYGLTAHTAAGRTGVWLGNNKVAAIGIGVRRWVTFHGLALNVDNGLTPFSYMIPCGLSGFGVTSISQSIRNKIPFQTVCHQECFQRKTATFMILGNCCTRNCRFCAAQTGILDSVDEDEPNRIARAVASLGLKHVVITSVTRDDIEDGGAGHFAECIKSIRSKNPGVVVEVLTPDFGGKSRAVDIISAAHPEIFNLIYVASAPFVRSSFNAQEFSAQFIAPHSKGVN